MRWFTPYARPLRHALALAVLLTAAALVPYQWLEWFVVAVVHVGTIPAVLYPLTWRWRSDRWRDSRVGRALMRKAEALALLFVVSVLNVWMPGDWWAPVYAVVVTWVVVTLTRQYLVLRSVLREDGHA